MWDGVTSPSPCVLEVMMGLRFGGPRLVGSEDRQALTGRDGEVLRRCMSGNRSTVAVAGDEAEGAAAAHCGPQHGGYN